MFERKINIKNVITVIYHGEIIDDYPHDEPLPSYLVLGFTDDNPLHVLFAVDKKQGICYIVTVYFPDPARWEKDWKTRRKA